MGKCQKSLGLSLPLYLFQRSSKEVPKKKSVSQMSQISRIVFVIVFVPKKFRRSSKKVPKKFQKSFKKVPEKFQKSSKKVPKKFQKSSKKVSKKVSKKFQKVPKISTFLVRSCLLITLITCPKGHRSLRVLY